MRQRLLRTWKPTELSAFQTSRRAAVTGAFLLRLRLAFIVFVSTELHGNGLDGVEEHLGNLGQSISPSTTQTARETNPK